MRSKRDMPNKTDYMKAYSFNLILTEKTNCELESAKNAGKIDGAFYRNFSWQIMGEQKARQKTETNNGIEARAISSNESQIQNDRLPRTSASHEIRGNNDKVVVQSRTDYRGSAPKRFVSTCYFKPKTVPAWYTESLLIHIGSTKRNYEEKVWFKHRLSPYYWSETMTTDIKNGESASHISKISIPIEEDAHYISLEAQQIAVN